MTGLIGSELSRWTLRLVIETQFLPGDAGQRGINEHSGLLGICLQRQGKRKERRTTMVSSAQSIDKDASKPKIWKGSVHPHLSITSSTHGTRVTKRSFSSTHDLTWWVRPTFHSQSLATGALRSTKSLDPFLAPAILIAHFPALCRTSKWRPCVVQKRGCPPTHASLSQACTMHAVIMDDAAPPSALLKAALLGGHISAPRAMAFGTVLGRFFRALRTWGRGMEAGGGGRLCEALAVNIFACYALVTYGRVYATPPRASSSHSRARRRATWRVGGNAACGRGASGTAGCAD